MGFIESSRAWARKVKRDGMTLWYAARHPATPWYARALGFFVVGYALSPIDLIPDFIPVLGYLDDVILLPALIWLTIRLLPTAVLSECRAKADAWLAQGAQRPRSTIGAVVIVSSGSQGLPRLAAGCCAAQASGPLAEKLRRARDPPRGWFAGRVGFSRRERRFALLYGEYLFPEAMPAARMHFERDAGFRPKGYLFSYLHPRCARPHAPMTAFFLLVENRMDAVVPDLPTAHAVAALHRAGGRSVEIKPLADLARVHPSAAGTGGASRTQSAFNGPGERPL